MTTVHKKKKAEGNNMNIYQKIVEIRKRLEYLKKDADGYGYKYVKESTILGLMKEVMDEQGLVLMQELTEIQDCVFQQVQKDKSVKESLGIRGKLKYTWINAENPEDRFSCDQVLQYSNGDIQGCGGLLSYGMRYFLLKFFNIPTDDLDPDKFTKKIDSILDEDEPEAYNPYKVEPKSVAPNKATMQELQSYISAQGLSLDHLDEFLVGLAQKKDSKISDVINSAMAPALQSKFLSLYRKHLDNLAVA